MRPFCTCSALRPFLAATGLLIVPALWAADPAATTLGNLVVAGDSLSAGYQDDQLIDCSAAQLGSPYCFTKPSGQQFGYANVVAKQAGENLNLPLIPPPGYPQIAIDEFSFAVNAIPVPREPGSQGQTFDVAVPGFTLAAFVGFQPSCSVSTSPNPLVPVPIQTMALEILDNTDFNEVLSGMPCTSTPPTELQEAASLAQTYAGTSIMWIGSNDALSPLLFYGVNPTDPFTFASLYQIAITTMRMSSKHLVIANIPDVTLTPYLTSIPQLAADLGLPVPYVEQVFGLHPGDMVTPYAFELIQAMGKNLTTLPAVTGTTATGLDPVVIRFAEIITLRQAVQLYNLEIEVAGLLNHVPVVDIYGLVNRLAADGYVVNGQKLTTNFMGGLFSLDGVHPSDTGYAIIANQFIQTMNHQLGTNIPLANVSAVALNDPFVFPTAAQPPGNSLHVSRRMADGLRQTMGRP